MERESQTGKQAESRSYKPRVPRVWREFSKWVRQTPDEIRYKGARTGEWPEGTPQEHIDIYTKTTVDERILGELFDEFPSIEEIQARPADYLMQKRRERLISQAGEPTDTNLSIEELEAKARKNLVPLKEQVEKVLNSLTPRERSVLQDRFGLEDGRSRTKEELAQKYNCSPDEIEETEARALRKLRQPSVKTSKTSEQQEDLDLEKKFKGIKERIITAMIKNGANPEFPCIVGRDLIEVVKRDMGNDCFQSLYLNVDGSWSFVHVDLGKNSWPITDQSFDNLVSEYARLTDPKAIELDDPFVEDKLTEEEQEKYQDELDQYILQNKGRLAQSFVNYLESFAAKLESTEST